MEDGIRSREERISVARVGYNTMECTGEARVLIRYTDEADGEVEHDALVTVEFDPASALDDPDSPFYDSFELEEAARTAASALAEHLVGPRPTVTPPAAQLARGDWTTLGELGKGLLFETEGGQLAVKSEYSFDNGFAQCVLLGSGEYAAFREGNATRVREVRLA